MFHCQEMIMDRIIKMDFNEFKNFKCYDPMIGKESYR